MQRVVDPFACVSARFKAGDQPTERGLVTYAQTEMTQTRCRVRGELERMPLVVTPRAQVGRRPDAGRFV